MRLPGKLELPGRNLPAEQYVCFALFCISQIPLKTINHALRKARDGSSDLFNTTWEFWLATPDWKSAGAPRSAEISDASDQTGTETPVQSFTYPFLGRDLASLGKELRAAPQEAFLDRDYFAVLDERTAEDGSVVLCRVLKDGEEVDWLRVEQKRSSLYLSQVTAGNADWDELKDLWNQGKREFREDVLR